MSRHTPIYIRILLILVIFGVIGGYILFNSRILIDGPSIEVTYPQNGATLQEKLITIEGRTKNTTFISVNDRPISVDEEGFFRDSLLLLPGYNIITIEAKDKFEREISKRLDLYYGGQTEDDFQVIKETLLSPDPATTTDEAATTTNEIDQEEPEEAAVEENSESL